MPNKIYFTQDEIENIISVYYKDKLRLKEIAKKFNISHGLLGNLLKKYYVINKSSGRKSGINPAKWGEVIELYLKNTNLSVSAIAKIYQSHRITVENILKYYNIPIRGNQYYSGANLSKEQIINFIFDYKNDVPIWDLRKKYKISEITLYKILKENNCELRSFGKLSNKQSYGISGYYNGIYFRSMNEISFIINYLENKNLEYFSPESKRFYIEYIDKNKKRKYYPDFITDKYIFECKPKRFWKDTDVVRKMQAAKKFAAKTNKKYILVDYPVITEKIILKIKLGLICFTEKGQIKFNRYYSKLMK